MQLGDLDAHLDAQAGVEVGERLVEQEDARVADDGAADGDALALAAGELLGLAVEQVGDLQDAGRVLDPRLGGLGVDLRQLEAEAHVVVDGHVRVERVGLEHHRDAALGRRQVVDDLVADQQLARGDVLEPGDQAQQGGLAAARGADEDHELVGLDRRGRRP